MRQLSFIFISFFALTLWAQSSVIGRVTDEQGNYTVDIPEFLWRGVALPVVAVEMMVIHRLAVSTYS